MKRCWFGLGVLVLILVLGLLSAGDLARLGENLSRQVALAAEAYEDDPARASEILADARNTWQRHRFWMRILSDHKPVLEADTLFALLADPPGADIFLENALRLSRLLGDLGSSQLPNPENIL